MIVCVDASFISTLMSLLRFLSYETEEHIENDDVEEDVDDDEEDEDLCNSKPAWPSKSCSKFKDDDDELDDIFKFDAVGSNWDAIKVLV